LSEVDLLATPAGALSGLLGGESRGRALRKWSLDSPRQKLTARIPGVGARVLSDLAPRLWIPEWRIDSETRDADGTTKWAIRLRGGDPAEATVETVLIPSAQRATVCVSSQAGCTRRCAFCATASMGFKRNLRAGEIVIQYQIAAAAARARGLDPKNVVFMGMGEPLDNLAEVVSAVSSLVDVFPGLSRRRVTVSTSGVAPMIPAFLSASEAMLALSLNATTDEIRTRVMPHNKTWPLAVLMDAVRLGLRESPSAHRRLFVEYVLLPGVNDAPEDATRLAALVKGLDVHVNVIPHNPFAASPFRAPSTAETIVFHDRLKQIGLRGMVRWPHGRGIAGACGQLATRSSVNSAA
jgi:23S rRNA (adenine2503-C2)-methyltransferase